MPDVELEETLLPGVGVRYQMRTRSGQVLGAPRLTQRFADLSREVPGLESARISVREGSPFAGRTLGDTRARTLTGCSVVAIVRGADVVPSPAPGDRLIAGDVLVAIGSTTGLAQLDRRLAGQE